MRFDVISSHRAPHQLSHQAALIDGLAALGIEAKPIFSHEQAQEKYVACWGWRIGKHLRDRGHEVLVMERGYIGDRFAMTSLAWNGLNGHGRFPDYPDDGGARFRRMATLEPWKFYGDYALILGQVPHDASLGGRNLMPWYEDIAREIHEIHKIPVLFRQHPDMTRKGLKQYVPGTIFSNGTLQEDLGRSLFTVCYNSNSGVDSVLAGVPAVVDDQGSMAYQVAGHDLRQVVQPYREPWAHALAWKQWDIEEIRSGAALRGMIEIAW